VTGLWFYLKNGTRIE